MAEVDSVEELPVMAAVMVATAAVVAMVVALQLLREATTAGGHGEAGEAVDEDGEVTKATELPMKPDPEDALPAFVHFFL